MGNARGPGQSRWTEQDREIALAWFHHLDELCSGCGVPRDEAWSKDAIGKWRPQVRRCHVCAAQESATDAFRRDASASGAVVEPHGLKGTAVPVVD